MKSLHLAVQHVHFYHFLEKYVNCNEIWFSHRCFDAIKWNDMRDWKENCIFKAICLSQLMDVANWLNHSFGSNVNVQKTDFDDESECILIFNYHNWIKTFTEIEMNGKFLFQLFNAIFFPFNSHYARKLFTSSDIIQCDWKNLIE